MTNKMKCPICKKEMMIKSKDNSYNTRNGKRYFRNIYWCRSDDVWMNLEIPVKGKKEAITI